MQQFLSAAALGAAGNLAAFHCDVVAAGKTGRHTQIGQGADTVFTQMAAEVTGITEDKVNVLSTQDTDVSPFDTGAYASRQTYVSGMAVKKTGAIFKEKILDYSLDLLLREEQQPGAPELTM